MKYCDSYGCPHWVFWLFFLCVGLVSCDTGPDSGNRESVDDAPGSSRLLQKAIPDTVLYKGNALLIVQMSEHFRGRFGTPLTFEHEVLGNEGMVRRNGDNLLFSTSTFGSVSVTVHARDGDNGTEDSDEFVVTVADYCDVHPLGNVFDYLPLHTGQQIRYSLDEKSGTNLTTGFNTHDIGTATLTVIDGFCSVDFGRFEIEEVFAGTRNSEPFQRSIQYTFEIRREFVELARFGSFFRDGRVPWPNLSVFPDSLRLSGLWFAGVGGPGRGTLDFIQGVGLVKYAASSGGLGGGRISLTLLDR